ncbi:hypothetical protein EG328_010715 [Venturia inaequalis]|uniref:rRNA methyltransferase 2, mitochondrial n=1 Tax=Venturia inaequalis TaxID=5025 RepID=A0A8H3U799_VENIN|nr:hypothetical protein EG328_010715 [Venturia inaequalis]
MLTRRVFQQLTDSFLLNRPYKPQCLCALPSRLRLPQQRQDNRVLQSRNASSSSSTRWKSRQSNDRFSKEAKVQGLKSRAAFKLLEINDKYHLFSSSQTVVDLGYAPGSWSQVAIAKTAPNGRVIGIDILPVQPPKGVSTIQGNFLSPAVQEEVRAYVQDPARGRLKKRSIVSQTDDEANEELEEDELEEAERSYLESERHAHLDTSTERTAFGEKEGGEVKKLTLKQRDAGKGRVVDVVLSDMSAPWEQTTALWVKSVSNPYYRMMNTSGISFKDHAGSMDLCMAALTFCYDTLRTGGHFVCKYYQGNEEKDLELRLKRLFEKVHREKPESSRNESKEAYFVGIRRKETPTRQEILE